MDISFHPKLPSKLPEFHFESIEYCRPLFRYCVHLGSLDGMIPNLLSGEKRPLRKITLTVTDTDTLHSIVSRSNSHTPEDTGDR